MRFLAIITLFLAFTTQAANLRSRVFKVEGGTGFLIKAKSGRSYLLTNWHVCDSKTVVTVYHETIPKVPMKAKVLAIDPEHDLCLAAFGGEGLSLAKSYQTNERVFVLGHPLGCDKIVYSKGSLLNIVYTSLNFSSFSPNCPRGFYLTKADKPGEVPYNCVLKARVIDTSVPGNHGNSGSPIFNKDGEVVGIINQIDENSKFLGGMDLNVLKSFLSNY